MFENLGKYLILQYIASEVVHFEFEFWRQISTLRSASSILARKFKCDIFADYQALGEL